ncbi:hypothetical protein, partial [Stenotrophomonas maltophilia]|uniref:hypothetical protein n=1 Tax=Stenotrophomonas maltophilia TaxID=40324 RepID=UPI001C60C6CF
MAWIYPANDRGAGLLWVVANLGWRRGSARRASTHGVDLPGLPASGRHYPAFPSPKEKPRCVSSGVLGVNPGDDLLSHGLSHTTIGAAAFHFR